MDGARRASRTAAVPGAASSIPALDGLRAIAIIIVMLSHFGLRWIIPGQFGVTLFFFISGYLITTLLRREMDAMGAVSLKAFYLRRAVRILAPMYLAIALAGALSLAGIIHPMAWRGLGYDFAFLSNYWPRSGVPIGLWSLCVEEHFYLAFPALFIVLSRRFAPQRIAAVLLGLCALVLAVRGIELGRGTPAADIGVWTHTRIDSILFGAVLALWNNPVIDRTDRLPKGPGAYWLGGAMLLITFTFRDETFRQTLRWSVQGIALLIIVNAAIRDSVRVGPLLDSRWLKRVADHSYVLYLVNSIWILVAVRIAGPANPLLAACLATIASFVTAMLVRGWIELPLGRWRRGVEQHWRSSVAEPMQSRCNGG